MFYEHCTTCVFADSSYGCKRKIMIKENNAITQVVDNKKETLGHKLVWLYGNKADECKVHSKTEITVEQAVQMDKQGVHPDDVSFLQDIKPLFKKQSVSLEKKYKRFVQTEIEKLTNPTLKKIAQIRETANLKLIDKIDELGHIIQS